MRGFVLTTGLIIALFGTTSLVYGQQATEIFIPLGQSPGQLPQSDADGERAIGTLRRALPDAGQAGQADRAEERLQSGSGAEPFDDAPAGKRATAPMRKPSAPSAAAGSEPAVAAPAASATKEEAATAGDESRAPPSDGDALPGSGVQADPEAWLRFIEALVEEGESAAARSNFRAFRARYPDHPLPSDLLPLAASVEAERP